MSAESCATPACTLVKAHAGPCRFHVRPPSEILKRMGATPTDEEWHRQFAAACRAMPNGCSIISTAVLNDMEAELARLRCAPTLEPTIDSVIFDLEDAMHACCAQPLKVDSMNLTRAWRGILERFRAAAVPAPPPTAGARP